MTIKTYICLLDTIDPGHAINSAAHAGTIIMLNWADDPIVKAWLKDRIRKVTCAITANEFIYLTGFDLEHQVITEAAFNDESVGIVFKPQLEWPKYFKYLKLWGK